MSRAGKDQAAAVSRILADITGELSWPPAEYSAAASWCPHCAFPLASVHHRNCIGYIVGAPGLPLCSCPCNEQRRAAAAARKSDELTDRPQWWHQLPAWKSRST